jgi:YbbR domain-containing protein
MFGSRPAWLTTGTVLRLVVSFILALLLWGWVYVQQDPIEPRSFAEVPLQPAQLPGDLRVFGELGNVAITVEGPRSLVDDLGRNDLRPRLDLSRVEGPDAYSVGIVVDLPDPLEVTRVEPDRVSIIVDEYVTKRFDLTIRKPAVVDATRRVGEVVPEVSEVTVSGSKGRVDQVAQVVLPIEIGDSTRNFARQFEPVAEAGDGQTIPEVMISPQRIAASVEVEAIGRSVPVLVQTFGSPGEGYEVVGQVANPASVLVDGPDEVLNGLFSVTTERVSILGATETVTARVGLTGLPPEVVLVDPVDGQVDVVVQIRERGTVQTLPGQPVIVEGLAPGLEAVVEPAAIAVDVFAAEDTLTMLQTGDVVLRVSVAGKGPGVYTLPPEVTVPPEVQWIRTAPDTVTVVVRPASATPPAEATAPRAVDGSGSE